MPGKRKSSQTIARKKSMAKKYQRLNETGEENGKRLANLRTSNHNRIANESSEEKRARLRHQKDYDRTKFSNETSEKKKARLEKVRYRMQELRSCETTERRNVRLAVRNHRREIQISNASETETIQRRQREHTNNEKQRRKRRTIEKVALFEHHDIVSDHVKEHCCGDLDVECQFCHSLNFPGELPADKKFTSCCHKGKVFYDSITCPFLIEELLTMKHPDSENFLQNIRKYNNALAFASMGAQVKPPPGHGPYCFRVHGQVYHQTGPLHPLEGEKPVFAQIYILDPEEALQQRLGILANTNCKPELMNELGELMNENNELAKCYKTLHEVEQEEKAMAEAEGRLIHEVSMAIVTNRGRDPRRYNAPRANEVAIIFKSTDGAPPYERDLIVHCRSEHRLQRIYVTDPNLDAMTYPLLYPGGEQGWKMGTQFVNGAKGNISQLQYYSYMLAIRSGFNPILSAGKLTQQYCVDAYCKVEASRLNYLERNQSNLRVENYTSLKDHVQKKANEKGLKVGKQIILPSSFQGSPRAMSQHYQDAMAIVRKFGKPDGFLTMTCNPKWPEITQNLKPWQKAEFRPDLIARVFKQKLKALLDDIMHNHIFGVPVAKVHVIEFQKRGLPHAHILFFMRDEDKPKSKELIDKWVSAEIPDPKTHPKLHKLVLQHMIHGPCGTANPSSPCMQDGKCTKNFPKRLCNFTNPNIDGFPWYRRREVVADYYVGGKVVDGKQIGGKKVDNGYVVPYNPYLLLKYNCHINLEICASVKSIKYLFKYIYKGHDCATVEVTRSDGTSTLDHNEVESYIDSRYVSAPEAVWRIFEFKMHDQSHSIQKLAIHLPNEQPVIFEEGLEDVALDDAQSRDDTLTAWFKLNQEDQNAHQYLYHQIPEHYTFIRKGKDKNNQERVKFWKPREKGHNNIIGRMYNVVASQGEIFFLRLLLLHVRGATSFENLRTVNGVLCENFKHACVELRLLEDDTEWQNAIDEVKDVKMPHQLRELFAFICVYCAPVSPIKLWEDNLEYFIEDYRHKGATEVHAQYHALIDVQNTLIANGKSLVSFGLPLPPSDVPLLPCDGIDFAHERELATELIDKLNPLQKFAFDKIMTAVDDDCHPDRLFFLDGPGGSGKTFTYDTLYHNVTGLLLSITCCASTGIAANLLPFGRTYHSTFGLGPNITKETVSGITINTAAGQALRDTNIIVWDEVTMTPFAALEIVDRLLRDLTNDKRPFGGKVILLGGDFRQCLPVVPHGDRVKIVEQCVKGTALWEKFIPLQLKKNMRVINNDNDYCEWLLKLGNGELTNDVGLAEDIIEIPPECVERGSLIDTIYGKRISPSQSRDFQSKAILCPKNTEVNGLNNEVLQRLDGESKTYSSADTIMPDANINPADYPMEFLNTLTPSGTPPHKLTLKVGAIIMLLRNLNPTRGLCNGTRLIIEELRTNVIIAKVLTGKAKGQTVFIPRIDIIPSETGFPFQLRRRQFPIMLAFVMTINKSQGQSFDSVGIYLVNPVFAHGQLYVAFSRARSKANVRVRVFNTCEQGRLLKGSDRVFTKNVVYKEVFETPTFRKSNETNQEALDEQWLVEQIENYEEDILLGEISMPDQLEHSEMVEDDIELIDLESDENSVNFIDGDMDFSEYDEYDQVVVDDQQPTTSTGGNTRHPPPPPHNMYYCDSSDDE